MNLDMTFCASDCTNYSCKRMLSYSVVCAHEDMDKPIAQSDFSDTCEEYKYNKILQNKENRIL